LFFKEKKMLIRDISSYDSNINFSAHDGFIIRGLRSNGLLDSNIDAYVTQCIANNKPFSFYHYINFYSDIQIQLNKINTLIAKYPCTFRSAIDLESDIYDNKVIPANISEITHAFLDGVPNSFLYCCPNMYETYLDNSFDKTDLWLAQYDKEVTKTYLHINVFARQYQEKPDLNNFKEDVLMIRLPLPTVLMIDAAGISNIKIAGWATAPSGINRIDIYLNSENTPRATTHTGVPRPDVADNLKNPDAANSGFDCDVPLADLPKGIQQIRIAAIANDGTVEWKIIKFNG
jgi:hypothetical protein